MGGLPQATETFGKRKTGNGPGQTKEVKIERTSKYAVSIKRGMRRVVLSKY